MPDIAYLTTNINLLLNSMQTYLPGKVQAYAAYALDATKKEVEKSGVGAKYSTAAEYVSQQSFINRSAFKPKGKKGEAKKGSKPKTSMYVKGGYKQLRNLQGLESSTVNLVYTYDMMSDIQVLGTQQTGGNKAHAVIGATDATQKRKLAANRKRYGNFLQPRHEVLQPFNEKLLADVAKDVKQLLVLK